MAMSGDTDSTSQRLDVKLVRLVQTCSACPSQWDGWDAEGNYYYIRYRFGHLTVSRVDGGGPLNIDALNNPIYRRAIGHPMDGEMCTGMMLWYTGMRREPVV